MVMAGFTSFGTSVGGGNHREDEDSDFYDGYEDQVVDLHGTLKEYRDFMLSMSARCLLLLSRFILTLLDESVESSTSLVILSDTVVPGTTSEVRAALVASPTSVLDLAIHSDSETEPSKAPLSPPLQAEIPFDRSYYHHPNRACVMLIERKFVRPQLPLPPAYRAAIVRFRAASLSTWYPLLPFELSSLPSDLGHHLHHHRNRHHHYQVLIIRHLDHCIVGAVVSAPTILTHVAADRLPPRKRLGFELTIEATAETTTNPVISPVHTELTVGERLDEHEEVIEEIYKHLLEIPLPRIDEIKQDLQTLRDKVAASEGENTTLRKRVRALELGDLSLKDSLRTARARQAEMQFQVRHTADNMHVTRRGLSAAAIEQLVNQRVADALAAQEANQNNKNGNESRNRNEVNRGVKRVAPIARDCTHKDFLNCQPRNFSRTEGVVDFKMPLRWQTVKWIKRCMLLLLNKLKTRGSRRKTHGDNRAHQPPFKRQNVARAYMNRANEKKGYVGSLPYCNKCKLHLMGQAQQGNFKKECPKLRDYNRGNHAANGEAHERAYALGGGEANHDSNVVTELFDASFLKFFSFNTSLLQEGCTATATVHHHSIPFKMNNKKRIVNLEYFREMLHIYPRIPNQTFDELSFEEEILAFMRNLGHNGEIKKITDKQTKPPTTNHAWNKTLPATHESIQPWISDLAKQADSRTSFNELMDTLVDFSVFLMNRLKVDTLTPELLVGPTYELMKGSCKSMLELEFFLEEVYDPRLSPILNSKIIQTADDQMFTTIKLVLRHQNTQQFGAMLPIELTNEDIRNSAAYKEYYAIASGAEPPKTKASKGKQHAKSSKAKGLFVLSEVALTEAEQIKLAIKRSLQQTHISQASGSGADEVTGLIPGVLDVPTYKSDEEISSKSNSDNDGDDFVHPKLSTHDEEAKDEESFDPIVQTPSHVDNSDDESNDDESHGMNVGGDEGPDVEDDDEELYGDVNINLEGQDVQMTDVHTTKVLEDTHVTLTPVNPDGQQESSSVSSQFVLNMLNPSPDAGIDSLFESTPRVNVPVTTTVVPLLVTAPTLPPPSIPIISQAQQAPAPSPTTASSTSLQDLLNFGSLFGFDHRLKTLEANFSEFMQTNQFAEVVSSIPGIVDRYIDHQMNEPVKVAVQLQYDRLRDEAQAENEDFLNKLDENIQKIIKEQVKIILDTYGDTVTLKRRRNDEDKDEEPSAGSDRGSREDEQEKSQSQPVFQRKRHPRPLTSLQKAHQKTASDDLAKQADSRTSFNELMDSSVDFSAFLMNRLKVDTLTPELLAGPTYELMKGSCKSLAELKFFLKEVYKATTNQLDWNNPEGQQYLYNLLKPLPLIPLEFYEFAVNMDSARDVYSKRRIIAVTKLQIVEWHNYKHLDWIIMRRDNDKLYKFKEGDLKRLRIQDIEEMLLLLVQGKLTNLTVKERFAFNVSLRMFTRSIVIQRHKQNRLMRIDELHKFGDDTLNDVRTALYDRLKGVRMKYLPQTIWRRSDKERAAAMIQAIDKQLKTRRIMRSL
nr:hypothetical protein [Tanacetum cinerariifolium]